MFLSKNQKGYKVNVYVTSRVFLEVSFSDKKMLLVYVSSRFRFAPMNSDKSASVFEVNASLTLISNSTFHKEGQ